MQNDAVLIERTLAGDPSAFEQLVNRYKGVVLALALQYTQNFHDAQDIAQEAFFSAYVNLPELTDASRFKPWLFQIVVNRAKMWLRQQTRRAQREETVVEDWAGAPIEYERFVESLAWREIIGKAMESLSPSDQAVATFYFLDDHTCREVADVLGLPAGTVRRRLCGIRRILGKEVRAMLNEHGTLKYRVGIETLGGVFTAFFDKGTPLPAQKTYVFTTAEDEQQGVSINLFEGDADLASGCRSLGRIIAKDFSIGPRGTPQIAITFSIEKDGALLVDAVEKPQGKRLTIEAKTDIVPVSVQTL